MMYANKIRAHHRISAYGVLALLALLALLAVFLIQSGQSGPAYAQSQDQCLNPAGSPQNFKAVAGDASVTLTWAEPADWGNWSRLLPRYYVLSWKRAGSGWDWNVMGGNQAHGTVSYTFSGAYSEARGSSPSGQHTVTNGIAYEFQIQAVWSSSGCGVVASSSATTSGTPVDPKPPAPTGVTSSPGAARLDLAWTAPPGSVTGYDVEYKLSTATDQAATTAGDPSTGWVDAGHSGTTASQAITNLTTFDTYYDVRVRAVNANGNGPWAFPAVWTATLTVKALGANAKGCSVSGGNRSCNILLTNRDFSYGGVDFSVLQLADFFQVDELQFALTEPVGPLLPHAVLHVGDASFPFISAVKATQWETGDTVKWASNFEWTINDLIPVRLTNLTHTWPNPPVSFGDATIDDMHFTAGAETPDLISAEYGGVNAPAVALPAVTGDAPVTYTATGLPAGLYLGVNDNDRVILGTPEAATDTPVTVTYTATDTETGESASLTFQVTVAPPVVFDADQLMALREERLFEYTVGQTGRINETLPVASGGHGGLTYRLTYKEEYERTTTVGGVTRTGIYSVLRNVDDDAPGFSFDSATRVLTSDTGGSAPSEKAFYALTYSAIDANGAVAFAHVGLAVRAAPSLPEVADQSFTVGAAATLTLPEAEGGVLPRGAVSLDYALSPAVDGLSFSGSWDRILSGTPVVPGSTVMTYTVTDANGVTDTETFTITVANGTSAPSSAPASLRGGQDGSAARAVAFWDAVTGATGYVVQLIESDGSYPDKPVNAVPDGVTLRLDSITFPTQAVFVGIGAGDYKVRVAARNDDGVGPWSAELSFTVRLGGV